MNKILVIILLVFCLPMMTNEIDDILTMIDENIYSDSQIITSRMEIHGRRVSREIVTKSWSRGDTDSFIEYLSPPREAGTKMLKLDDKLWIYDKNSDRIIQMSGHLLRQSVNGSDLSYEDFMDETEYHEKYKAEIIGEEVLNNSICKVLMLTAKEDDATYYQRKIWVDMDHYLPLKEELYGENGTLLKLMELSNIRKVNERWYPFKIYYKDVLNTKGKGTFILIDSIEQNAHIPDSKFSKASLRK